MHRSEVVVHGTHARGKHGGAVKKFEVADRAQIDWVFFPRH